MYGNKLLAFILAIILTQASYGQMLNNSPYTRYGLGEIMGTSTAPFSGFGGLSAPIADFKFVNVSNPATYSSLARYNPIFDVAVYGKSSNLKTGSESVKNSTFVLRNFTLALPIAKKWGAAFGLMPYSTTGYNITDYQVLDGDSIANNYTGDGSINRAFIGAGCNIINQGDTLKLSVGVNASFLFGTLERERNVVFSNSTFYNTKVQEKNALRGMSFDGGIHFYQKMSTDLSWQFGATYSFGSDLKTSQGFYAYTYKYQLGVVEDEKDTIDFYDNVQGLTTLPTGFSTGVAVSYKKWMVGCQYEYKNWHQFKEVVNAIELTEQPLKQSNKFTLGFEYKPSAAYGDKNKSIFKKSIYRIGFHYGNTPIEIDSTQLTNFGMNLGISVPLISSRSLSMMNIGIGVGKMGTTDNNLIQENYFKIVFGFSMGPSNYDKWFRKRKYD